MAKRKGLINGWLTQKWAVFPQMFSTKRQAMKYAHRIWSEQGLGVDVHRFRNGKWERHCHYAGGRPRRPRKKVAV